MKPIKISFLFFLIFLFCFNFKSESQNKSDSTNYYIKLINNPKTDSDLIDATLYLQKANKNNSPDRQVYNLIYIARAQRKMGLIFEGEDTAVKALKLLDKTEGNYDEYKVTIYNFLGILYYEYEDYQSSSRYYNQSLELNKNSKSKSTTINNIGNNYKKLNDYKSAISFYKKSLEISLNYDNKKDIARALDNLGSAQLKISDTNALKNLQEALNIRKELNYQSGIITSYLHLGEYYKSINDKEKALEYANEALIIADSNKNKEYKKAALTFYTNLSSDKRVLELNKLNKEIEKDSKLQSNKYASKRYSLDLANEEINQMTLNNEKQKVKTTFALLITLFIVILSLFIFFLLKSRHKKDKIKQVYLKETEISKKVHDELANDMSDLMNFVENDIEVSQHKKSTLLDNIEDIYIRTRDISTETGNIDLANFSDSIKHLLMQHNKPETKVVTNDINAINWQSLEEHKKVVIYRCLQELLVNMKKHSKAKVVSIVFKNHNKKKEIRYVDDGLGFSIDETKLNGLSNVESRINGIGGSFNFTTSKGNGFKATLEFNS